MCTVSRGFALRLDQLGKLTNRLCSERASKPNYKPPKLVNHLGQNKMMKRRGWAGQGWPSYKGLWVTVCESQWAVRTSGQRGLVSFVAWKRSKGDKEYRGHAEWTCTVRDFKIIANMCIPRCSFYFQRTVISTYSVKHLQLPVLHLWEYSEENALKENSMIGT